MIAGTKICLHKSGLKNARQLQRKLTLDAHFMIKRNMFGFLLKFWNMMKRKKSI